MKLIVTAIFKRLWWSGIIDDLILNVTVFLRGFGGGEYIEELMMNVTVFVVMFW